ncbi:5962_t:CDS:2, partial [Ambispora gerdemannii]
MIRPGRLDKLLYVELPTPAERHEILKTLTKKTPLSLDVDLKNIAEDSRCEGFSGADLASLIREAAVSALRESIFFDSDSNVAPSVSKPDKRRYEALRVKFGGG